MSSADLRSWWWTGWWQEGRSLWPCWRARWRSTWSLGRGPWTCGRSHFPASLPSRSGWRGPAQGQKSSQPCRRSREKWRIKNKINQHEYSDSPHSVPIAIQPRRILHSFVETLEASKWFGKVKHPVLLSYPSPWSLTAGATKQCDKRREHFALCVHKSEWLPSIAGRVRLKESQCEEEHPPIQMIRLKKKVSYMERNVLNLSINQQ